MKRRRYITALGGLAGASSLAVGSGAFNFSNIERRVSISVADDRNAFLKLTQRGSGGRSSTDGHPDTVEFELPGDDDGDYPTGNPTDPNGLGPDSVYRFDQDAGGDETGIFAVSNQGTHPVEVFSTQPTTADVPSVTIFDVDSGNLLTEDSPSAPLGVGEQIVCGLEVDTHGVSVQPEQYTISLLINAEATDS